MLRASLVVAACIFAAGSAYGQDVSVSCVGACSPAWDTDYELRVDAAPRDSLLGLTIKSRSLADGRTRPGDTCIGGGLCPYTPTSPGEYRLVGELSINGVRGMYTSENTITV